MIDLSGIDWNWWLSIAWWLVPVVALIVLGILWNSVSSLEKPFKYSNSGFLFVASIIWLFAGGIISMLFVPMFAVSSMEDDMTVEQLEEQGFTHVDLRGSDFTASKAGKFFQGTLFSLGDFTYQVVEVPTQVLN